MGTGLKDGKACSGLKSLHQEVMYFIIHISFAKTNHPSKSDLKKEGRGT